MAQLLLELFSEEIPAGLQIKACKDFEEGIGQKLNDSSIEFESVNAYSTTRRVAVVVEGIQRTQKTSIEERRGPRVGSPDKAIEGFLSSTGLKIDELEQRTTDKGDFYFAVIKKESKSVSDTLAKVLQDFISSYTWAKSMYWGEHKIRWIRPLHNILCLFDGDVLPIQFGHITSNNKTSGHRFLGKKDIEVTDFSDYKQKLEQNSVILDIEDRKEIISKKINELAKSVGLKVKEDSKLLEEVAGLVEFPVPLLGTIEEKFMSVPQEVLITAMRSHQKYFSVVDDKKKIAPYFITVSNIKSSDDGKQIIAGNERVLRARLEDAKFFWDTDRRNTLESKIESLNKVIFHAKLGTVAQKVSRITDLSKFLAVWVPHANLVLVERAAKLSKADLTTEMVGEFPELQGFMGSYYAIESKEDNEVADAIKEHYKPVGPNDACPKAPLSVAVAIADKIDTLVGLFAINEKPTGSKDPYALRRAALGVIRLIVENKLHVPLKLLIEKSMSKYPPALFKIESQNKKRKLIPVGGKKRNAKFRQLRTTKELLDFIADRLRVLLKDRNIRHDIIQAVFDDGNEDDLTRLVAKAEALQDFLDKEDGINLLAAYKRATNIVLAEEKKDNVSYFEEPDVGFLEAGEEKSIYKIFNEIKPVIKQALKDDDFVLVMKELAKLRKPVDEFFDNVTVNCEDKDIRKNRLYLLSQLREFLNNVANFSKIEG
ncbi:MAG: glycine--tRNA ligase subunit beta [Rickettsiales bacterium]|nr:glycine--tRNA ligase subunit beta [Pseudomonadota bacterium]MDA0966292.1 glycine--tRNA ligase subunit beta [Pseudomonadota bacterium]MDG4543043.1 glycine--tRNA ligase subunit beta [Rickettsiales bacterium]MDG4545241.1 glycine--tRNA ligase subunit beta [Rickettsiales bacterium]MDG4547690.1 glycine--tRNA ligase subunit beta [Rickettsiales bacterium]